jgi:thiol:disulfide interchange protein/DsbC/DsbD-like thiol-disulfide interchange protein
MKTRVHLPVDISMLALLVGLTLAAVLRASAAPVRMPHVEAELVSSVQSFAPGQAFTVALRLAHEPHWHTYWKNPGDSGMATAIAWQLPEGWSAGPIQWPAPQRLPIAPLTNFGYEGEVFLLADIRPPDAIASARAATIEANAQWLVCKEICLPGGATLRLSLPTSASAQPDPRWGPQLTQVRERLPVPLKGWTASVHESDGVLAIRLRSSPTRAPDIRRVVFFPDEDGIIENAAEQTLTREGGGLVLRVAATQGLRGRTAVDGLLVAEPGWGAAMPVAAAQVTLPVIAAASGPQPGLGLLVALALALAGGMILNLMPCVFPVVSIKVLGFVEQSQGDAKRLRTHGLVFAAGVLVSFWAVAGLLLALRASGLALGWGYQLQSPLVVAALAVLFSVLALNLSGVFETGARVQALAGKVGQGSGYRGSFLAGLLATLVATPCTAPFMGAALGYAMTQSAAAALLVFSALAVGMAAPYVALSAMPRLLQRLPRPGRWMETFKQVLAFPLYITVVWLVWVLGRQQGVDAAVRLLASLVLLAAALWALGRWSVASVPARGRASSIAARAAALLLVLAAAALAWPAVGSRTPARDAAAWAPYSATALQTARGSGQSVFVDFTAAWCVTCQVNKKVVLESEQVQRAFREKRVRLMRADWTHRDATITAALSQLGRSGVPVYALYSPAGSAPSLLPEILTRDTVLRALHALP